MKKLLLFSAAAFLIASCGTKPNNNASSSESKVSAEQQAPKSEVKEEPKSNAKPSETSIDEKEIIVNFLKAQNMERYCIVDVDGDNREEIVAFGDDSYTVYGKDADKISDSKQLVALTSTFGMSSLEYGKNHLVVIVGHFNENGSWQEYFSTELKNSKIVSESSFTGSYSDDDFNNCSHGPTAQEMKPCSKEDVKKHFPAEGLKNVADLEFIDL